MPYRVSLGFEDNNGIVKTTWMKRFNTSVNVAPSFLDKHLNFNFTAKYMFEKDRYAKVGDAIGNALSMDPTQPVYGNGEDYKYVGGYFQYLQNKSDQISDPDWKKMAASQVTQNPVAVLDNYKCIAKSNDISGNLEVDYKIHGFEDLHLHAAIGAQYTDGKQNEDISSIPSLTTILDIMALTINTNIASKEKLLLNMHTSSVFMISTSWQVQSRATTTEQAITTEVVLMST